MVHTDHASLYFSRPHLPPRSIVLSSTPRPAADSSTHSGVSPRLAAYRVSLLLNGRGEEGTSASCSPRSKVLGRSSATMPRRFVAAKCFLASHSVLHRRRSERGRDDDVSRWLPLEGGCWFRPPRGDDVFEKISRIFGAGGRKIFWQIVIVVDSWRWYISLVISTYLYFSFGEKNVL